MVLCLHSGETTIYTQVIEQFAGPITQETFDEIFYLLLPWVVSFVAFVALIATVGLQKLRRLRGNSDAGTAQEQGKQEIESIRLTQVEWFLVIATTILGTILGAAIESQTLGIVFGCSTGLVVIAVGRFVRFLVSRIRGKGPREVPLSADTKQASSHGMKSATIPEILTLAFAVVVAIGLAVRFVQS